MLAEVEKGSIVTIIVKDMGMPNSMYGVERGENEISPA